MINICKTKSDIQKALNGKSSVGFVPTMGNLHEGHLSLIKESLKENETSVVSIFVNPTQFGENEDFDQYPRTLEADVQKIESLKSGDQEILIFAPLSADEIYEDKVESSVKAIGPVDILEGHLRPGHFDGMTTVVYKLFNIVKPNNAYFGKKDYQQLCLVKLMVEDKNLDIKIKGLPIIREDSGLALSSRNQYLKEDDRHAALKLNKTLNEIKNKILQGASLPQIESLINEKLQDPKFNYLSLRDGHTLSSLNTLSGKVVILGNYQLGHTKLLDNIDMDL